MFLYSKYRFISTFFKTGDVANNVTVSEKFLVVKVYISKFKCEAALQSLEDFVQNIFNISFKFKLTNLYNFRGSTTTLL